MLVLDDDPGRIWDFSDNPVIDSLRSGRTRTARGSVNRACNRRPRYWWPASAIFSSETISFGVEVVRRLADDALPDGVQIVDFGIRSLDLVCAAREGYETTNHSC